VTGIYLLIFKIIARCIRLEAKLDEVQITRPMGSRRSAVRVTRGFGKNRIFFQKVAQKVSKLKKCQKICNKAQIESPNFQHQTTFEILKYLQQTMF
jgi:hypothetical protein